MKTLITHLGASSRILIISLFLLIPLVENIKANNSEVLQDDAMGCNVPDYKIERYLRNFGYEVYQIEYIDECTRAVYTQYYPHFLVYVYLEGEVILGHEELP